LTQSEFKNKLFNVTNFIDVGRVRHSTHRNGPKP